MAVLYRGKGNAISLILKQDGATVEEEVVNRAQFWLPASASPSGRPVIFDTDTDTDIQLEDLATKVTFHAGDRDLRVGTYEGYLTVFDADHPEGLAWSTNAIEVKPWYPE